MDPINRESRSTVYFHIHYLLAMPWAADPASKVQMQKELLDAGLEFEQTQMRAGGFVLSRKQPTPLQIRLDAPGPQLAGLKVSANNPGYVEMFARDVEAVIKAYRSTWRVQNCQVIQTACELHHLYSSQDHAFKFLWEQRLGQSPEDFKLLGSRPVSGGGLRLLLPPHQKPGEEPRSVEIRMESFLREPRNLLIQTVFTWPRPRSVAAEEGFEPERHLGEAEQFASNEVWAFLMKQPTEGQQP